MWVFTFLGVIPLLFTVSACPAIKLFFFHNKQLLLLISIVGFKNYAYKFGVLSTYIFFFSYCCLLLNHSVFVCLLHLQNERAPNYKPCWLDLIQHSGKVLYGKQKL